MADGDPVTCRVVAVGGHTEYSLHFEFLNRGHDPIDVQTYDPFLAFDVLASVEGQPVTVHQPALDIPINPMTIHLAPGVAVSIATPIRLRISATADQGSDGFVWTIPYASDSLELEAELHLPPLAAVRCPIVFE